MVKWPGSCNPSVHRAGALLTYGEILLKDTKSDVKR
jgi:hypothetical protein